MNAALTLSLSSKSNVVDYDVVGCDRLRWIDSTEARALIWDSFLPKTKEIGIKGMCCCVTLLTRLTEIRNVRGSKAKRKIRSFDFPNLLNLEPPVEVQRDRE